MTMMQSLTCDGCWALTVGTATFSCAVELSAAGCQLELLYGHT
jgi:hypothetical protein